MGHIKEEVKVIESGANAFKLLEFRVGEIRQGINILKISKIIKYNKEDIRPIFNTVDAIAGLLNLEDYVISIVDLRIVFAEKIVENPNASIVVTEFNQEYFGFIVDDVSAVHKVSWKNLQPVNETCPTDLFISVATVGGKEILLTDFETIVTKVYPDLMKLPDVVEDHEDEVFQRRKLAKIICADDSKVIRLKLKHIFKKHDFEDITIVANGQEAYDIVFSHNKGDDLGEYFTFMVTDIEMPKMNGLTLCKKIKAEFPDIPVLILSSLVSEQLLVRVREVNADTAVSKNQLHQLIDEVDRLLLVQEKQQEIEAGASHLKFDTPMPESI